MSGKGSAPRPYSVPLDEYGDNFDAIFGKKQPEREQSPEQDKEQHQ